jgi:hypothetical protein
VKNQDLINDYKLKESHDSDTRRHVMRNLPRTRGSIKKRLRPYHVPRSNVERRRRVRCHCCEPCTRDDCGDCKYCKDMKKFGGTGISKQCCLSKQCLNPLLPTTTICMLCKIPINRRNEDKYNSIYECEFCFEIFHQECFKEKYQNIQINCIINEDLSNCWQCGNCISMGYNIDTKNGDSISSDNVLEQLELPKPEYVLSNEMDENDNNCYKLFYKPNLLSSPPPNQIINKNEINISVESLSNYEKRLILREFCEMYSNIDDLNSIKLTPSSLHNTKEKIESEQSLLKSLLMSPFVSSLSAKHESLSKSFTSLSPSSSLSFSSPILSPTNSNSSSLSPTTNNSCKIFSESNQGKNLGETESIN